MTKPTPYRAFALDTEPERQGRIAPFLSKWSPHLNQDKLADLKYDLTRLLLDAQSDAAIRQSTMALESYMRSINVKERI